jgi:hypothetical protein
MGIATWTLGFMDLNGCLPPKLGNPPACSMLPWENQRTKYRSVLVMFDYQDVADLGVNPPSGTPGKTQLTSTDSMASTPLLMSNDARS